MIENKRIYGQNLDLWPTTGSITLDKFTQKVIDGLHIALFYHTMSDDYALLFNRTVIDQICISFCNVISMGVQWHH